MLPESQLRTAVDKLSARPAHGPYSRCVAFHYLVQAPGAAAQPMWGIGSFVSGGRYNPPNRFETIYLAEDPITALAETWRVFQHPQAPQGITFRTPPLVHIAIDGVLLNVLDVTDQNVQKAIGTTYQELTGEWRLTQAGGIEAPTQILGRVAYTVGRFDAIRAPSSKNAPGGACVAVFPNRLVGGAYLEVYDPYGDLAQRLP